MQLALPLWSWETRGTLLCQGTRQGIRGERLGHSMSISGSDGKEFLQCRKPGFNPWVRNIPWKRKWQPTPMFLPGEPHGQRTLVGYSPWGYKELDTTEQLTLSLVDVSGSSDLHLCCIYQLSLLFVLILQKWQYKSCLHPRALDLQRSACHEWGGRRSHPVPGSSLHLVDMERGGELGGFTTVNLVVSEGKFRAFVGDQQLPIQREDHWSIIQVNHTSNHISWLPGPSKIPTPLMPTLALDNKSPGIREMKVLEARVLLGKWPHE